MKKKIAIAVLSAILPIALSGCVGMAVGAGATAGVAAAQEGGVRVAASDTAIRIQIADAWFKHSTEMYSKLDATVKEGRVLITGSVPYADMRVDAVRLVWQVQGVRQVINEIRVDGGDGVSGYLQDTWITGDIKSHILLDKYIQSINYTIETVGGVVYLMGIAQDQKELDRVIAYARNTKYVKNVVSYVRLRGDTPPVLQTPTNAPPVTNSPATNKNAPADGYTPPADDRTYSASPAPVTSEPLR